MKAIDTNRTLIIEAKKGGMVIMKRFKVQQVCILFSLILGVFLIAGCGGGGGGEETSSSSSSSSSSTGAVCVGADCVSLGTAGDLAAAAGYVILAKSGVAAVTTPNVVTGNIGISPSAASFITGFSLDLPAGSAYSTSAQVTGKVYAPGYADPTPANLTAAVSSMETAYTAAAAKATTGSPACPGTGDFGGKTLAAGVYTCAVDVSIPTATILTLNGSATDVWVFQITGNLSQAADTSVNLTGGALPQNVFWQVSGNVNVLAGAHFKGILLAMTDITFGSLSSINGRLFSQTAVNLNATTVTQP